MHSSQRDLLKPTDTAELRREAGNQSENSQTELIVWEHTLINRFPESTQPILTSITPSLSFLAGPLFKLMPIKTKKTQLLAYFFLSKFPKSTSPVLTIRYYCIMLAAPLKFNLF